MDVVPDSVPASAGGDCKAPRVEKNSGLNSSSTSLTASSGLAAGTARCPTCGLGSHGRRGGHSGDLEEDCADGATSGRCPAHAPEFGDYVKRLETYKGWPEKIVGQKPSKMAEAGLYYIGSADRVQCFYCGKRLRNWEKEDDPKVEHRKNCPDCRFAEECLKPGFHCPGMKSPASQMSEERQANNLSSMSSQGSSGYFSQGSLASSFSSSSSSSSQPGSMVAPQSSNFSSSSSSQSGRIPATTTLASHSSQASPQQAQLPTRDRRTNGDSVDYDKYGIMMEAVKQFGLPEDVIKRAIESRHYEGGPEFKHAGELFEAAERAMKDTQAGGSATPRPDSGEGSSGSRSLPYSSQMPSLPAVHFPSLPANLHTPPPMAGGGLLPSSVAPSVSTPPTASNAAVIPTLSQTITTSNNPTSSSSQMRNPLSQRSSGLLEENRRLRGDFRCRMCRAKPCDTTFLPCGHYVTCRDCASRMSHCCVCNRQVMGTVRTYLA